LGLVLTQIKLLLIFWIYFTGEKSLS